MAAIIRNIAVGVVIRDGHALASLGQDKLTGIGHYRALGGGIEFGETAAQALQREFREELGIDVESGPVLGVLENIFEYEGQPGHEIIHVFAPSGAGLDALDFESSLVVLDEGSPVRWINLRERALPFYPDGALELLGVAQP